MRAFNHHLGSPSMALVTETVDVGTAFKQAMARLRRKTRHLLCTVVHGGHELYRARTETKLYQQCLLCGYETHGLDDRSPRSPVASREQHADDRGRQPLAVTPVPWADRRVCPADRSRGSPVVHQRGLAAPVAHANTNAHQPYGERQPDSGARIRRGAESRDSSAGTSVAPSNCEAAVRVSAPLKIALPWQAAAEPAIPSAIRTAPIGISNFMTSPLRDRRVRKKAEQAVFHETLCAPEQRLQEM